MPRPRRFAPGGLCYHAIQRSNGGAEVFAAPADYDAFLKSLNEARRRVDVPLLAFCLMPIHVHLVARPTADGDLSRWMQWLFGAFARRYHGFHGTSGHLWQGRFKSFPIQEDGHLLTVLRYVERNPRRAGLVERAQDWRWSSLAQRQGGTAMAVRLTDPPIDLPADWPGYVERALTGQEAADDLARLRRSVQRGRPFGDASWTGATAAALGLGATLRNRGRPKSKDA